LWPAVPLATLGVYKAILWDTGDRAAVTLSAQDQTLLQNWLALTGKNRGLMLAGDNIASQQREMHRFATEFVRGPVAVNDLGWVSYRNEHYVLDLWGLGSEEARRKRLAGEPGWADALLRRYDVGLVMIYDDWVGAEVPPDWVPIGRLTLARPRISPARAEVAFYARPDRAAELLAEARRFAAALPAGAAFQFAE